MKKLTILTAVCAALALGACGGDKKKDDAKVAKADDAKPEAKADDAKPEAEADDAKPDDEAAPEGPPFTHIAFGRLKTKGYDAYKAEFDKHQAARAEAGVKVHWIQQDAEDPNVAMVAVGIAGGLDKFKEHMNSEEVKKAHADLLDGEPEFMLMGEIKHGTPDPEGVKPVGDLFVAHEVADFDKWLEAFKGHSSARTEASVIAEGVVLAEDGKTVGIHMAYTDDAKIKAFASSEDLKKVMADAGVQGEPTMFWGKPGEEKLYEAEVAAK